MIVRLDRPRGSRRSSKKKVVEQGAAARVFKFNGTILSDIHIWVPASVNTSGGIETVVPTHPRGFGTLWGYEFLCGEVSSWFWITWGYEFLCGKFHFGVILFSLEPLWTLRQIGSDDHVMNNVQEAR
jgi:hypothetical protein